MCQSLSVTHLVLRVYNVHAATNHWAALAHVTLSRYVVITDVISSGAEMNLKKWGGGGTRLAQGAGHFFVVPLHFFCTISRFGERFCDAQYSLVSFLFAVLLLTVPPCSASEMTYIVSGGALNSLLTHTPHAQPFVKVGGHVPPCPVESAPPVIGSNQQR